MTSETRRKSNQVNALKSAGPRLVREGYGKLSDEQKAFNRMLYALRAIVEHSIRVAKRLFGFTKVRYRGFGEKCCADRDAVCAGQPLAGTPTIVVSHGRGAPVKQEKRRESLRFCGQRSKIANFSSFFDSPQKNYGCSENP